MDLPTPLWVVIGLAMGPTVALGLARFAYALLLPPMRAELGWNYAAAGALNTSNAAGYLAGALVAVMLATGRALEARAAARASRDLTALVARTPRVARVHIDGTLVTRDVDDLRPGDLVAIDPGAHVSGPPVVGPAIIGEGTKVTGSYIGPFTAIGPDCVIDNSEIQYSIVLRRASIRGIRRIEASLIGHDTEVTPAPNVPHAHRLILGDHSRVQISS